jgi:hypothetical protein
VGPVKPVSGEAAFPAFKPASAVKGTASVPSGAKPPLAVPAGNEPVLPKAQVPLSFSFLSPPASPGAGVQEPYKQTAALLGLPQDTLSFVLISAIRCFSLPPEAALLSRLRGDLLASGAASTPKTGREKAALETKALAAAAAADKGLRLSPEALEEYAAAMEPGAWFSGGRGQGSPEGEDPPEKEETPEGKDTEKLYAEANRSGEKNGKEGLLSWLNRFPGKNGQSWTVFPFKIKVEGVELKVSVRLLIKSPLFFTFGKDAGQGCVIIDIEGTAKNWRFILERSGNGKSVMDITVYPGQGVDIKAMEKEAGKFFSGTEIRVRGGDEAPFLIDQLHLEALPSVNKEM